MILSSPIPTWSKCYRTNLPLYNIYNAIQKSTALVNTFIYKAVTSLLDFFFGKTNEIIANHSMYNITYSVLNTVYECIYPFYLHFPKIIHVPSSSPYSTLPRLRVMLYLISSLLEMALLYPPSAHLYLPYILC